MLPRLANPAELERVAKRLERGAVELEHLRKELLLSARRPDWEGEAATACAVSSTASSRMSPGPRPSCATWSTTCELGPTTYATRPMIAAATLAPMATSWSLAANG